MSPRVRKEHPSVSIHFRHVYGVPLNKPKTHRCSTELCGDDEGLGGDTTQGGGAVGGRGG